MYGLVSVIAISSESVTFHLRKVPVVLHVSSSCSPTLHTSALNSLEGDSVTSPVYAIKMVVHRFGMSTSMLLRISFPIDYSILAFSNLKKKTNFQYYLHATCLEAYNMSIEANV